MLWNIFSVFIYVPILTICVLLGIYVGFWVAQKQDEIDGEICVIIGGAVGLFFLFPIVCAIVGLG